MAELLYRIGQFSGRRAWLVIVTWVLVLVATVSAMAVSYTHLTLPTNREV